MIAENKAEFFEELGRELQRLGVEDTSELLADFEEHFAEGERRGISDGEVCRELGSIREIARSCLDIKSSAINSIMAHEVSRKKAVSLTKPGRDVPADPSLAKPKEDKEDVKEDAVRSVTPEHIAEEVIPGGVAPSSASQSDNSQANASQNESSQAGSQDNSQNSTAESSQSNSQSTSEKGVFERLGKRVDAACDKAGQALNGAFAKAEDALDKAGSKVNDALKKTPPPKPSDSYRGNINDSRKGEIPLQNKKVKTKDATRFVDYTQLTPNINPGLLAWEIVLDVLLWVWLVPVVIVATFALFVGSAGIVCVGVWALLGHGSEFGRYFLPTRILFALGFVSLASFVACIASALIKPAFALPKYVARRHLRAVYGV